ncbi:MAG: hypothetical protein R3F43_23065 [bacterium]
MVEILKALTASDDVRQGRFELAPLGRDALREVYRPGPCGRSRLRGAGGPDRARWHAPRGRRRPPADQWVGTAGGLPLLSFTLKAMFEKYRRSSTPTTPSRKPPGS